MTGLANGTPYTFSVAASNELGASWNLATTSPVTPVGVPTAPVGVRATPGDRFATVSWGAPPSNGGRPVNGYQATIYDVTMKAVASSRTSGTLSCTVKDLDYGTYTVTATAHNAIGTSRASDPVSLLIDGPTPTATINSPTSPTNSWTLPFRVTATWVLGLPSASDFTTSGTATGCRVGSVSSWDVSLPAARRARSR